MAGPCAGPSLPAGLRLLSPQDFQALRTLHHRIVDLAPPGTVARETDRFLADRLGPRGQTLGLFADGKMMIAYAIVGLPQDAEEALIQPEEVDPPPAAAIAVLDGVGVLPAWRGGGLQRMLCELRCELALAHGRQVLRATAAPANPWSWCNLLHAGLVVTALLRLYGGAWRYLMATVPGEVAAAARAAIAAGQAQEMAAGDLVRQEELLRAGWLGAAPASYPDRNRAGAPAILFVPPSSAGGR